MPDATTTKLIKPIVRRLAGITYLEFKDWDGGRMLLRPEQIVGVLTNHMGKAVLVMPMDRQPTLHEYAEVIAALEECQSVPKDER